MNIKCQQKHSRSLLFLTFHSAAPGGKLKAEVSDFASEKELSKITQESLVITVYLYAILFFITQG